jgi:hypothetical protein
MRIVTALTAALFASCALAKLPPPDEAAKAQATETAAKAAWTDKVALYQLCNAQDRTADAYRRNAQAAGKEVRAPVPMTPCSDPGPFVSPITPPGTATAPPNTAVPAAELSAESKK